MTWKDGAHGTVQLVRRSLQQLSFPVIGIVVLLTRRRSLPFFRAPSLESYRVLYR
jgi:hypothetical protein